MILARYGKCTLKRFTVLPHNFRFLNPVLV